MIRNLKALGLALVAVFAMSAMAASAAQAEDPGHFGAAEYPATINAVGETVQEFVSPTLGALTCANVSGVSTLEEPSDELTGENIQYSNCDAGGGLFPVTVDTNNCHFTFELDTMIDDNTGEGGVIIEGCDDATGITITVFAFGSTQHLPEELICEIHVPEQTVGNITYHNITDESTGKEAVTVEADESTVASEVTEGGICNEANESNIYNGSFIATAENEDEEDIDATITST